MTPDEWYRALVKEVQRVGMPDVSDTKSSYITLEWFMVCARRVANDTTPDVKQDGKCQKSRDYIKGSGDLTS